MCAVSEEDGRISFAESAAAVPVFRHCQALVSWLPVSVDSALYCDTKINFRVGVQSFERRASKLVAR